MQKIKFSGDGSSRSAADESSVDEVRDRLAGLLPAQALEEALEGLRPEEIAGPRELMSQLAGRVLETALGAERQFRKIIGYKHLARLAVAVERHLARLAVAVERHVAAERAALAMPTPIGPAVRSRPSADHRTATAKFHGDRDILRVVRIVRVETAVYGEPPVEEIGNRGRRGRELQPLHSACEDRDGAL